MTWDDDSFAHVFAVAARPVDGFTAFWDEALDWSEMCTEIALETWPEP